MNNIYFKKYKEYRIDYKILKQIGGGIKEICDRFIYFRRKQLSDTKTGVYSFVKLRQEICTGESIYFIPLTTSARDFIGNESIAGINSIEILGQFQDAESKTRYFLDVLKKYCLDTQFPPNEIVQRQEPMQRQEPVPPDECSKLDVHKIYDVNPTEGKLYLGSFELGADIRNELVKRCIIKNNIKLVVSIMDDNFLTETQWADVKRIFDQNKIRQIQIREFIDYIVDDHDNPNIMIAEYARQQNIRKFTEMLKNTIPIINSMIASGSNVLVHCVEGKSRSVSVVTAWLAQKLHITRQEALKKIKEIRRIADPNKDYIKAVDEYLRMIRDDACPAYL